MHVLMSMVLFAAPSQAEKVDKKEAKWLTKYQDALALAQKEGKPLVVDAGRVG